MHYRAQVLHNYGPTMLLRYERETANLCEALTFDVMAPNTKRALDAIWCITNVDTADDLMPIDHGLFDRNAEDVRTYRALKNRSFSVADVILLREVRSGAQSVWTCPWRQLHHTPTFIATPKGSKYSASFLKSGFLARA